MISKFVGLVQGLRYATDHPPQRKPRVIQFPVNDICNSRCQMCDIWKQKRGREIQPEEVRELFAHEVFSEVKAVGINGGEPTLRHDLGELVQAILDASPRLNAIYLISNCIQEERVKEVIRDLGERCSKAGVHLDVMVSLDGYGEVHDRVRRIPGNFESARSVLEFLENTDHAKSFRIGCTIVRENAYNVEELLWWCMQHGYYARFRVGVKHQRLYNEANVSSFSLTDGQQYHVASFLDYLIRSYETGPSRKQFYRSLRDQLVYDADRTAGCAWKYQGATILSDGGLGYCAVESDTLGDALEEDPGDLYWSNSDHLSDIVENKCATCLHDYDGAASRSVYLKSIFKNQANKLPDSVKDGLRTVRVQARRPVERLRVEAAKALATRTPGRLRGGADQRVLITGWYGTETLGDKAILGGILDEIERQGPSRSVDVTSLEPYVTRNTLQELGRTSNSSVLSLDQAKDAVRSGRYGRVIVGGGPLMSPVGEVIDLVELAARQHVAGGEIIVAGCGVGPLGQPSRDEAIATLLEISDRVLLRDEDSRDRMEDTLGVEREAWVAGDPAIVWVADHGASDTSVPDAPILLGLRDWPLGEYAQGHGIGADTKDRFEAELVAMIDHLAREAPDRQIIPFCMHKRAAGGDDRFFYRRLLADRPEVLTHLDDRHRSPEADLQVFVAAGSAVTMRFHSSVFAAGTGTPFEAIDYSLGGKVRGFARDLGMEEAVHDPRDIDGEALAERVLAKHGRDRPPEKYIQWTRDALAATLGGG